MAKKSNNDYQQNGKQSGEKKKHKKKHRLFWFFIRLQIFLMLIVGAAVGYYYAGGYAEKVDLLRGEAKALVDNSDESIFIPSQTMYVYDAEGELISQKRGAVNASYVKFEDIPSGYVNAIISVEDKKFYSHNGVDFLGILRAVKAMIQNGEVKQGASTITMQLAKLIYMDSGRDWEYKVKQMFVAMELEKVYSKNKIMEFYLNNIYFANGYYGIQSACRGYFNCELSELSLSQTAFLLAIPNSPTYYDPVVNYSHTLERRNKILYHMAQDGKIDNESYQTAMAEDIILNRPEETGGKWNNYVDTYVHYCATRALMQAGGFEFQSEFDSEEEALEYAKNYEERFAVCQKDLFTKGYSVYTSINLDSQTALQESIDAELSSFTETNEDGIYKMQSAGVCINNDTGMVEAIVGGRKQDFPGYTLNRAYQSFRQPGSAIKPLNVYTPCFERMYTPDSIVKDQLLDGGPKNSGGIYYGEVPIRFAVAESLNTVAWQLYEELTPAVGLQYLKNMKFAKIVDSDYVPATAIGGFTVGVSALEMAAGYETIEHDGIYREPSCVLKILDAEKNVVYQHETTEIIVYKETASRMMTSCLQEVFGNGTAALLALNNGMPAAGKTGTTNDLKDGWFVGYTRYYTTSVWVGCDIPTSVEGLHGSSYPGRIWKNVMDRMHAGKVPVQFPPYAQLSEEFFSQEDAGAGNTGEQGVDDGGLDAEVESPQAE